jgi:hypothetical protein
VRRLQALGSPTEGSLAAWPDQQSPQHVRHERYDDKDEEYLYWSQAHSHIMHRPELLRKPLVGEKGALRVTLYPRGGRARLYYRVEEAEHDGSPHRRHPSAAPGRPRDPHRTPRDTDVHARYSPALEEAGRRIGIDPNRLRYYDAIKELEYEGAIEWDESARYARGDERYVITERGLKMLGEPD